MSKTTTEVKTIKLAHAKNGTISVAHIEEPYGEYSSPVASIAISKGEDEWKVHVPYENLDDLIKALNDARDLCSSVPHKQSHIKNLGADTGGGQ
jgi:hypothetical protein